MKVLAIVPSFNEEKNIVSVIESIKNENSMIDILIINDGSDDKTGALAESTGLAFVVNLPCNLGIGGGVFKPDLSLQKRIITISHSSLTETDSIDPLK